MLNIPSYVQVINNFLNGRNEMQKTRIFFSQMLCFEGFIMQKK
jgi:hypothetical protein